MRLPLAPFLTLAAMAVAAGAAIRASDGRAQAADAGDIHISSIGETIPASDLPGETGEGYLVFQKWCAGCHAPAYRPDDQSLPPTSRLPLGTNLLAQRYKGALPAALEERTDLTADAIRYFVRNGINAMPAMRKTEITDRELDALAAYLSRNAVND